MTPVPRCPTCKAPKVGGDHVRLTLPRPPQGKGYIVVPVAAELADRIHELDPNGHWEAEMAQRLEDAITHFYKTRPVELLRTPARSH